MSSVYILLLFTVDIHVLVTIYALCNHHTHTMYILYFNICNVYVQCMYGMYSVCVYFGVCLQFVKPILESPKSVSFICPSEVIKRLQQEITHTLNQPKTNSKRQLVQTDTSNKHVFSVSS